MRKVNSYGDPRLYAIQEVASRLANSQQPLVPERVFVTGSTSGENSSAGSGSLGFLLQLLVAEKSSFQTSDDSQSAEL